MGTALITGVSGQDGIYLARLLRRDGMAVVGTVRPGGDGADRIRHYVDGIEVVALDLRDAAGLRDLVARVAPDEVYNLAAVSSVGRSWSEPDLTMAVNATAVEVLVDAVLALRATTATDARFFQASSAETGSAAESPYARSKSVAADVVRAARSDHGLHACIGDLHIHESPLRAETFVSRKITRGAAAIALGRADRLTLGNLDVVRDWGFAGEYVEAIRRMVERDEPIDLPIGTGVPHALAELVATAFAAAGLGEATEHYLVQDPALMRPADTPVLVADPEPAARSIGWRASTGLGELIDHMVRVDLARMRTGVPDARRYLSWEFDEE